MKILKYENENYEILIQKHVFIKDKKTKSYYRNNLDSLNPNILKDFVEYPEKVNLFIFWVYILFNVVMISLNNFHLLNLQKHVIPYFTNNDIIIIISYFLTNVFLHELGHIYSLKFFGRKIDKVGFKLNFYVFPSIYVQMNESYMLSRIDKIIVHSFGLFINFAIVNLIELINILSFHLNSLTLSYMLFSSTMIWNLVPLLNSDGYKILLATFNLDEFNNFTKNHWLVLIIQFVGLSIAMYTLVHWIIYWVKSLYT